MTTKVGSKGQMVIPAKVRREGRIGRGDVLDVRLESDGRFMVVRLNKPPEPAPLPKARIIWRKGRHALVTMGRTLTDEQVRAALEDFP